MLEQEVSGQEDIKVQVDVHTLEKAEERGTSKKEIVDVIKTGFDIPAKYGRKGKAKVYSFRSKHQNKYFEHKRVEVVYIVEDNKIVTVTAYVFYGKWGEQK